MTFVYDHRLDELKTLMQDCKGKEHSKSYLIKVLHKAQNLYGYIDPEVIKIISSELKLTVPVIWGVASFYHYFTFNPVGKHIISVCMGTACYVKGADDLLKTLMAELKIDIGETTKDGLFTLQNTRCVGACSLAPVIMIDDKVYGHLNSAKLIEILNSYKKEAL